MLYSCDADYKICLRYVEIQAVISVEYAVTFQNNTVSSSQLLMKNLKDVCFV